MGIDWGQLFEQGKAQVEAGFQQVVDTGVPAIQSAAEQQAITWLQTQKAATDKTLNTNVQKMLQDPNPSNPVVQVLKNAGLTAAQQEYGVKIIAAVIVVGVVGYFLLK